jgi:alpha-1,6-mannosyltransferase
MFSARTLLDHTEQFAKRNSALLVSGLILEIGFAAFFQVSSIGNWTSLPVLFFVLFSIYLFAVWRGKKRIPRDSEGLLIILIFAVAFRLTLLFSGPVFSFDMYRYIWDGKVAASGINPYLYNPNATELSSLRDANWQLVNHKELRTGYPPLMEMLFEVLYLTFRSALSYKITFFLFDLGTIATICLILKELKLDMRNVAFYAWAPLPIIEISQTGHNVSVAIFFVLLSFLLLLSNRSYSSAGVMALAVVTELYPVFFAPVLFKRWGKLGTTIFLALTFVFCIPYALWARMGPSAYLGLLYAINTSNFNGSIFPLITNFLKWTDLASNPGFTAQVAVYAIYASLLLWALSKSVREKMASVDLMNMTFLLTGAVLLLDRSFFAWYMVWMIPLLAFYMSPSWLLLSGTIFLGYMKYNTFPPPPFEGVSPETALLITLVEYAPFYVLLAYELLKHKFHSNNSTISATWLQLRRSISRLVSTTTLNK